MVDHEPRVLENLEVLGHGGATNGHLLCEFDDRARAIGESFEDHAPRRVAECTESCLVSHR
jgi:hypothetical protein